MPTYEYECLKCGKRLEIFHKVTDTPIRKCSGCGGELKKLISAGCGLIFKGSGFYITDYKKRGSSEKAGSGEDKKGASESNKKEQTEKK